MIRFVAGAIGPPGNRTFYLQVVGDETWWFVLEKQQVDALARRSTDLLRGLSRSLPDEPDPSLVVTEPDDVEFRVGDMAIALDADEGVVIILHPAEGDDEPVEFTVTFDQLAAMAAGAHRAVAAGRPLCPRCGLPMDSDGHVCPSSNGDLRRRP